VIDMVVSRSRLVAVLIASLAFATSALAQPVEKFPSRAVTIVVGFAPGGGGDISMRWMAEYLRERWKVPVIVENKPGAGSTLAAAQVARAKPDGYTVILATSSPFTVAPYFQPVTYDPAKDFTYLFQFLVSAQPLFVKSDSQFKTMQELVAWGKSNPKKLFWSTAATNGVTHVTTQAAFKAAGVDATYVPYKGGAEALRALLAGDIQAIVAAEFPPHAAAGTVRLLAESGPDKIPSYPQVPTYRELGYPVSVPIFYGIAGPAGMPAAVVREWEAAATEMVRSPAFEELVSKLQGTPSFKGHLDFQATITDVYGRMAKLLPELGMKKD
jgi:tripartite-type tricarboxylate transporter receptor subunit TctC